jgi:hypothetical protein
MEINAILSTFCMDTMYINFYTANINKEIIKQLIAGIKTAM